MVRTVRNSTVAILFPLILLVIFFYCVSGMEASLYLRGNGFRPVLKTYSSMRFRTRTAPHRLLPPSSKDSAVSPLFSGALSREAEDSILEILDREHLFIEGYGLMQKLQGKRVMEDISPQYTVARLSDGSLAFADPNGDPLDVSSQGEAVAQFRDTLAEELDIPLLYVQAPQKVYFSNSAQLPFGLEEYSGQNADSMARVLKKHNVPYLDLQPVLADTGRYNDYFFDTDHHWTPEGAFLGWQTLAAVLREDYGFEIDPCWTDRDSFYQTTYKDSFLGSQGKRVGSLYAGVDDFTVLYPKNYTRFRYTIPLQSYDKTGPFSQALLFPDNLGSGDNLYEFNPYTVYSGGDHPFTRMKNLLNPDGPTVVLLRDSFACPLAPFLALGCGELVTIDLRYFRDNLMEYIRWVEADMVICLYSAGTLKTEDMFQFYPPSSQPAHRKPLEDVLELEKPALYKKESAIE